jgi:hypothetical protein
MPPNPTPRREAPAYIANLSTEERAQAERTLVRKIDIRLIPMIIIMYIMNYLDRNNIAAARLAGLEEELSLTSVQYQVCFLFRLLILGKGRKEVGFVLTGYRETSVSILFVGYVLMQSEYSPSYGCRNCNC